jgi:hypothetical protein
LWGHSPYVVTGPGFLGPSVDAMTPLPFQLIEIQLLGFNTLYFSASLPDGTRVNPGALFKFSGATVGAGRNVRGEVWFDVPQGQTVLIDYTDPLGSILITWEVSV